MFTLFKAIKTREFLCPIPRVVVTSLVELYLCTQPCRYLDVIDSKVCTVSLLRASYVYIPYVLLASSSLRMRRW